MNPLDLAQALELMAQALRLMPAGSSAQTPSAGPAAHAAPSRTLGAWLDIHSAQVLGQGYKVQTLLGHKHAEMTALYEDDRGLSAKDWKMLSAA